MVSVTSIYDKFQTVIPAEIRNEFNLDKSYKIEWRIKEDGKVEFSHWIKDQKFEGDEEYPDGRNGAEERVEYPVSECY